MFGHSTTKDMSEEGDVKTPVDAHKTVGTPDELTTTQALAQEYLSGWQRAKADYANLKRESESKYQELIRFSNAEFIKELLPLVDYFKQALRSVPVEQKGQPWVDGVRHIQSRLEQILAYQGVKEMEVIGEKFDPALHEAAAEVKDSGQPEGTIVEELRTGFTLHDKLLQAARVKVAA